MIVDLLATGDMSFDAAAGHVVSVMSGVEKLADAPSEDIRISIQTTRRFGSCS